MATKVDVFSASSFFDVDLQQKKRLRQRLIIASYNIDSSPFALLS
jgi:hypothetical protein